MARAGATGLSASREQVAQICPDRVVQSVRDPPQLTRRLSVRKVGYQICHAVGRVMDAMPGLCYRSHTRHADIGCDDLREVGVVQRGERDSHVEEATADGTSGRT